MKTEEEQAKEKYIELQTKWLEQTGIMYGDKLRIISPRPTGSEGGWYHWDTSGTLLSVGDTVFAGQKRSDIDVGQRYPERYLVHPHDDYKHWGIVVRFGKGRWAWCPFWILQKIT